MARRAKALKLLLSLCVLVGALSILATSAQATQPRLWQQCEVGSAAGQCEGARGVATNPETGHVYVADGINRRIDEYDAWGIFVKSWGWGVRDGAAEPQTCGPGATPPSATCQKGLQGAGVGEFESVYGLATDSAGDVYAVDAGAHRVQKFDPEGHFVLAFGGDVVAEGPDDSSNDEQQEVIVAATGGTFKLSFKAPYGGNETAQTAALPFNATAAEVQSALDLLSTIGGLEGSVTVSGGPGDGAGSSPYLVTFEGALAGDDVPQLTIDRSALGAAATGAHLACPVSTLASTIEYQWLRNGVPIAGATSARYTAVAADEGKAIQCQATTLTASSGSTQVSNPAYVAPPAPLTAPPVAPSGIQPPIEMGLELNGKDTGHLNVGGPGEGLSCSPGSWSGSPSFSYQWYLNGVAIPGAHESTYVATPADVAAPAAFQCAVTGANGGGATTAVSRVKATGNLEPSPPIDLLGPTVSTEPVLTVTQGGGPEVCRGADVCKAGDAGPGPGQLSPSPAFSSYIAVGPADQVYVGGDDRIEQFDAEGEYQREIPLPKSGQVGALAADPVSGDLYFSFVNRPTPQLDAARHNVFRIDPLTGQEVGKPLEVGIPRALAAGPDGSLYAFDERAGGNNAAPGSHIARILEFDPSGGLVGVVAQNEPDGSGGQRTPPSDFDGSLGIAAGSACFTSSSSYDVYASGNGNTGKLLGAYGVPPDNAACPPPAAAPSIDIEYAAAVGPEEATLKAEINPHFWSGTQGTTSYYAEYATAACIEGVGWGGGCVKTEPAPPGAGLVSGVVDEDVTTNGISLAGLQPDTAYRFRFVAASDGGGPTVGLEKAFTTFPTPEGPNEACANNALRTGASAALPDCRAYEMVSPVDKEGGDVGVGSGQRLDQGAIGGDSLTYTSRSASLYEQQLATRGAEGWSGETVSPQPEAEGPFASFAADLSEGWLASDAEPVLAGGAVSGYLNLYRRDNGLGSYEACTTAKPPNASAGQYAPLMQGASSEGPPEAIFAAPDALIAGAAATGAEGKRQLYDCSNGTLRLTSVLPDQSPSKLWNTVGTASDQSDLAHAATLAGAVSTDASNVYWSASEAETGPGALYLRVNAPQPESARLHGAASGAGDLVGPAECTGSVVNGSLSVSSVECKGFVAPAVGQEISDSNGGISAGTTVTKVEEPKEGVYKLTLSAKATKTKVGDSLFGAASAKVSNVTTATGAFAAGQEISGQGIPAGATVSSVGAGTLTLSAKATVTGAAVALSATSPCTEAAKACTLAVSKGTEARFWAASPDGAKALFSEGEALYRYDATTKTATLVAGKVKGVVGQSADLAKAYFLSEEQIGGKGEEGKPNLYLDQSGTTSFIATLSADDAAAGAGKLSSANPRPNLHTARASANGGVLVFSSDSAALAQATASYDNTDQASGKPASEIYRYDSTSKALTCLSCNRSGSRPQGREVGGAVFAATVPTAQSALYPGRPLSADGNRLFLDSYTPLLLQDANTKADVYEWEKAGSGDCEEGKASYFPLNGGCLSLISSGEGSEDSEFIDADPDGSNVFIQTGESLLGADPGEADLYDARVDGGFAPAGPEEHSLTVHVSGKGEVSADSGTISGCTSAGGPSCEGSYEEGATVTLTETPDPGNLFAGWGTVQCDESTAETCEITIGSSDEDVAAGFEAEPVEGIPLKVALEGTGSGTVKASSGLISCSPFCEGEYAEGTEVTLTASPDPGSQFMAWKHCDKGGVEGRQCTVSMDKAKEVGALFAAAHSLILTKTGLGKVQSSPAGISCLFNCTAAEASFLEGKTVTLKATPAKHFHLAAWGGACSGTGACEVSMGEDHSVSASFAEDPKLTVTLNKSGAGQATIKSHPAGVLCAYACSEAHVSFYEGEEVTLEVSSLAKGSAFEGWSGGGCSGTGACTVTMSGAKEVTAELK